MQVYGSHRSNSFLNLSSSDQKKLWQRIKIKILLKKLLAIKKGVKY